MAHESGTRASDLAELDSTWQQGVGCLFHQESSGSSNPSRYQFDMRRLHFEYGSGIEFKVRYSMTVLQSPNAFDIQEQVAIFHDATKILHEAREALKKPKHTKNLAVITDLLQETLDDIKKNPNLRHSIQKALHGLQYKPEWDLDNLILEKWHVDALTFLGDLGTLMGDLDLQHDVDTTRNFVKSIYDEMILVVEQDNLIVTEPRFTPEDTPSPPRLHQLQMRLAMIQDVDARSTTSAVERIHNLLDVYDDLYLVFPELVNQGEIRWPQVLEDAFFAIRVELSMLLRQSKLRQSLKDQDTYASLDVLLKGCCHSLISRIKLPVEDYLSKYLQYLKQRMSTSTGLELEHLFHELALKVDAFSMRTPPGITEIEWLKYAPRVFAYTRSQNFLNKLQILHAIYQKKAYPTHETSRLWLAIWQGLKTTYLIARQHGFKLNKPEFPVEVEFFGKTSIFTQFETVLSGPDALHPGIIDNIVAEYCTLVALCQERPDLEYNMLKQLRADAVQESVFENVKTYITKQVWDDVGVRSMQKCAIVLNHTLDGPAYIRRMDPRGFTFSTGAISEWSIVKIDLTPHKDPSSVLESVSKSIELKRSSRSTSLSQTPSTLSIQKTAKTDRDSPRSAISQYPGEVTPNDEHRRSMDGMHMVSAFDHVVYPFPETRAIEIAQSRQITREMSESGIYSRGALPEDVVNRPPRHTWPPGTISVWAKPLPIDPINVVKHLWSDWRNGGTNKKSLRQPRPQPAITPRTPRRDWVDEHPRLRPLLDRKNRISKPASKIDSPSIIDSRRRSTHGHEHTPTLRGGASSPLEDYQSPNFSTASTEINAHDQVSDVVRQTRFDTLYQRVRGFWPNGDVPRPDLLVDVFLTPMNWDVEAAYTAIREMAELGMLPDTPFVDNFDLDHEDMPQSNNMDTINDPFVGPDSDFRPGAVQQYTLPVNGVHHGINGVHHGVNGVHHGRNGLELLDTPTHPRRQVDFVRAPLQTLLGAQLLPAGDNDLSADAVDSNGAFTPAPFNVPQNPPGRRSPTVQNTPPFSYPAPNQQHQAQIDRRAAGFPPQQNGDHSDQENQSPQPTIQISQSPSQGLQAQPPCMARLCHPCPTYTGLFHHICTVQGPYAIPGRIPATPVGAQADSFLDNPTRAADTVNPSQAPAAGPSPSGPPPNGAGNQLTDSTSMPNGSNVPDSSSMPVSANNSPAAVGNNVSGNPTNDVDTNNATITPASRPTSPTQVAGHNLRNRVRLSARRAARAARLDRQDAGNMATTPTQVQQPPITNPVTPQAQVGNSNAQAASDDPQDPDWLPTDPAERRAHVRRRLRQQQIRGDTSDLPPRLASSSDSSPDEQAHRHAARLQQRRNAARRRTAASTPRRRVTGANGGRAART